MRMFEFPIGFVLVGALCKRAFWVCAVTNRAYGKKRWMAKDRPCPYGKGKRRPVFRSVRTCMSIDVPHAKKTKGL